MKIYFHFVFLSFFLLIVDNSSVYSKSQNIKIIYTSNIAEINNHDKNKGGLAELGTLIKQIKSKGYDYMFLHGGNFLAPSAMSSFDHGTHMIDILNILSPTAVAINKREFAYKEDELILRISEAGFPFISSNIIDPISGKNLEGAESSLCYDFNGFKICLFSLIDPEVKIDYLPDRIKIIDTAQVLEEKVKHLRQKGADLIVLLTGYSLPDSKKLISKGIIDIILEASPQKEMLYVSSKGIYAVQGKKKENIIIIDLKLNTDQNKNSYNGTIVDLTGYTPDIEVQNKINYYSLKLSNIMNKIIGKTNTTLNTKRNNVRTSENKFANFAADALRNYYKADIAFINGGSIRGDKIYPAGTTLTRKDIQSEFAFRNESRVVSISGQKIKQALENGVSKIESSKGRFLHVSGMKFEYCPTSPPGTRIGAVTIKGKDINPDKMYTLASNNYLLNGGDGFYMLKNSVPKHTDKLSVLIWEVVKHYIEKQKIIEPKIENRIIVNCQ